MMGQTTRTMLLAVGVAGLLCGCMPSTGGISSTFKRDCLADNPRFADAWRCVRARLMTQDTSSTGGHRSGLIEEGDLMAEQVRAGKISDGDARARLKAGLSHEPGF